MSHSEVEAWTVHGQPRLVQSMQDPGLALQCANVRNVIRERQMKE